MTFIFTLFRWLTRPPHVHIPFETPLGLRDRKHTIADRSVV